MVGCSLYRFYDAQDVLLYVGVTSVGPSRWIDHEDHRAWWIQVVRTTVQHFPSREEAFAAERAAIQSERPTHNRTYHPVRVHRTAVKRRHGTGGISLKPDGRWSVNCYVGGQRRQWSIRSEDAARLLVAAVEARTLPRVDRERAIRVLEELP